MDGLRTLNQPVSGSASEDFRLRRQLERLIAVSGLVLIAGTWRLWFPDGRFPLLPLFAPLTHVPLLVDRLLSMSLLAALAATLFAGRRSLRLSVLIVGAALVLLNQHRLQPWFYHLLLMNLLPGGSEQRSDVVSPQRHRDRTENDAASIVINRTGPHRGLPGETRHRPGLLRASCVSVVNDFFRTISSPRSGTLLITAGIYFWSGWSKLDATFLTGYGRQFVEVIAGAVGLSVRFLNDRDLSLLAAILPTGELIVALLLVSARMRSIGLKLSLVMHGLLLLAVGPFGLNHEAGVLLWNGYFILQNLLLMRSDPGPLTTAETTRIQSRPSANGILIGLALLLPALRGFGLWDNWPSWAVYSASPARVHVLIEDSAAERLPPDLRACLEPRSVRDGWSWLRLDWWSLRSVNAPLYPQDRFQLGLVIGMARRYGLHQAVRVIHEGEAGRFTGRRIRREFRGLSELESLAGEYRLGTAERPEL